MSLLNLHPCLFFPPLSFFRFLLSWHGNGSRSILRCLYFSRSPVTTRLCSMGELEGKPYWASMGVTTIPKERLQKVLQGDALGSASELQFRDPTHFRAGELHNHGDQWEEIVGDFPSPQQPRLCHDARFLNLWMVDVPFKLVTSHSTLAMSLIKLFWMISQGTTTCC